MTINDSTPSHADVMQAELEAIFGPNEAIAEEAKDSLWGLALSGGGIRSATFALGVLQVLASERALGGFHYQSTVSGGGYAGALLQGAIRRYSLKGAEAMLTASVADDSPIVQKSKMPKNRPLRHLREYSSYLSPKRTTFSGDALGMIATYVRNVILTQAQLFLPMLVVGLAALLAAPYLLQRLAERPFVATCIAAMCLSLAMSCLSALSATARRHPNRDEPEDPAKVVVLVGQCAVALIAVACLIGAIAIFNYPRDAGWIRWLVPYTMGFNVAIAYVFAWFIWFVVDAGLTDEKTAGPKRAWQISLREWAGNARKRLLSCNARGWRFLASSLVAAALAGALTEALRATIPPDQGRPVWSAAIWGTPLVFLVGAFAAAFQVGLAGRSLTDVQREVWARVGGKSAATVLIGVCGSLALLIVGPWLVGSLVKGGLAARLAGWGGVGTWLLVSIKGVLATARTGQTKGNRAVVNRARRLLMMIAPVVFVLGLWVGIGIFSQATLHGLGLPFPAVEETDSLTEYLTALSTLATNGWATILAVMAIASAVWLVLSRTMDANELSLNAFYRNRLVRCFLGATNERRKPEPVTNFDPHDDILLDKLIDEGTPRPLFPLIGATMNWVSSKQLDWQDRRATSFVLSPLYCGYLPPQGRADSLPAGDSTLVRTNKGRLARHYTLGTAIAMSGAAVSPNMGVRSSPAVTFLLTLFDARLGWWVPNRVQQGMRKVSRVPARDKKRVGLLGVRRRWKRRWIAVKRRVCGSSGQSSRGTDRPALPGVHLLLELLGLTHGLGRFAHISDGGHFENLALYELVRRRCRFILVCDAGADPQREFADLGNAIQKCRVDFGAEIEIDTTDLRPDPVTGLSRRHATLGKIVYRNGTQGLLLYIKPSLVGDEPADIHNYSKLNAEFPHQPTVDQFFDETQFECYRRLGMHAAGKVISPLMARAAARSHRARKDLSTENTPFKEHFIEAALHEFYDPVDAVSQHFSKHGEAVSRLFASLRSNASLAVLDSQFYPGWNNTAPLGQAAAQRATSGSVAMPNSANFRDCFYFCLELLQLMESVYIDLNLEANWSHPDNRGWINVFRHWSWSPMFRVTWSLSSQTFGARFVSFCENRVGVPRVVNALKLVYYPCGTGRGIGAVGSKLARRNEVNFAEADILAQMAKLQPYSARPEVVLLKMQWKKMIATVPPAMKDLTLGIAVLDGETLRIFRVQDHVRRLGLGSAFMRLLLTDRTVTRVSFRSGHYGAAGLLVGAEREALEREVHRMLEDGRLRRQAETEQSKSELRASGPRRRKRSRTPTR